MALANSARTIPFLENGDRLKQREFERCYAASPDVKKAELIETGLFHSQEFPGLVLDVPALLNGDMAKVLQTLQKKLSQHLSR